MKYEILVTVKNNGINCKGVVEVQASNETVAKLLAVEKYKKTMFNIPVKNPKFKILSIA